MLAETFNLSTAQLIGIIVGSAVGAIFLSVGVVLIFTYTMRQITLESLTGIPAVRPQQDLISNEEDGDKIDVEAGQAKIQNDVEELEIISSYLQPIPRWGLPSQQQPPHYEPKLLTAQIGPEEVVNEEEQVPAPPVVQLSPEHLMTLQRVAANNMTAQIAREIRKQDAAANRKAHHDKLKMEY
jgi:hypothetical protein